MASPFDPQTQPAQPPPGDAQGAGAPDVSDAWSQWYNKPANRAALIQFGVAMMQPLGLGETGLSHAANAVGYGGEAAANVEKQGRAQKESESKEELRTAQAGLAGAKAETQGAYAGARETSARAAEERAATARERNESASEQGRLTNVIRAQQAYQRYVDSIANQNKQGILDPKYVAQNPKPFTEWALENPELGAAMVGQSRAPTGTPAGGTPAADPYRAWSEIVKKNPSDPRLQMFLKEHEGRPDYNEIRQKIGLPPAG